MQPKKNFFEKHPKKTIIFVNCLVLIVLFALINMKLVNNRWTEHEAKSLKTIVTQAYFGRVIDNNVGRFIKLREFKPNREIFDRPSHTYLSHIAPNSVERKYYRVQTDQDGFMMGPRSHHSVPDRKIVFLGGSTTECLFVDEAFRFPSLVREHLEQKSSLRINTYNGGVSANESMHSLNILINKVLPMKPDVVVMMHNINDLVMLRAKGSYWYQDSRKSHIQTSKNVFTRFEIPQPLANDGEQVMQDEFVANLKSFVALTKLRGITPILMTQANRVEDDPLYHVFNQLIRDVCEQESVLLVDLAKLIPSTTDYIYDSYHYTQGGSVLAAKIIAEKLEPLIDKGQPHS